MLFALRQSAALRCVPTLVVLLVLCLGSSGCGNSNPGPRPDGSATLRVAVAADSDGTNSGFQVFVNNANVGRMHSGERIFHFVPSPVGTNTLEFVHASYGTSPKQEFTASSGGEVNVKLSAHNPLLGSATWKIDLTTVKDGDSLVVEDVLLEPDFVRREALKERVSGKPGDRYTVTRKRTIERQVTFSESAKTSITASASVGWGILELGTKIKSTAATKDTVLIQDKEEITQAIEVVLDESGMAEVEWIDKLKKGRATYRAHGKLKSVEFEVLYSSELTVVRR